MARSKNKSTILSLLAIVLIFVIGMFMAMSIAKAIHRIFADPEHSPTDWESIYVSENPRHPYYHNGFECDELPKKYCSYEVDTPDEWLQPCPSCIKEEANGFNAELATLLAFPCIAFVYFAFKGMDKRDDGTSRTGLF